MKVLYRVSRSIPFCLIVFLLTAPPLHPAPLTMTGDIDTDFLGKPGAIIKQGTNLVPPYTLGDPPLSPVRADQTQMIQANAVTPSGFHISRTAVYYDCRNDTLYIGLDVSNPTLDPTGNWVDISGNQVPAGDANAIVSRAWDADGDGNPCLVCNPMLVNPTPNCAIGQQGVLDPQLHGNGSQDIPLRQLSPTLRENYILFFDLNRDDINDAQLMVYDDGTPVDSLPGHKHYGNPCAANPTVHAHLSSDGTPLVPASGVDFDVIYRTASDSDYGTHRDIEFKIIGVSKIPLSEGGTPVSDRPYCDINIKTWSGSGYDSSPDVGLNWGRFNFVEAADIPIACKKLVNKPALCTLPDTVTYTLQATNNSPDTTTNITIADDGLVGGPWTFTNVAPGETVTVDPAPTKTFDASFCGSNAFVNTMTVTAVPVDCCATGYATASCQATVSAPPPANVQVNCSQSVDKTVLSTLPDTVTYTLKATNTSPTNTPVTIKIVDAALAIDKTFTGVAKGATVTVTPAPTKTFDSTFYGASPFVNTMKVTATAEGCACGVVNATASASSAVEMPAAAGLTMTGDIDTDFLGKPGVIIRSSTILPTPYTLGDPPLSPVRADQTQMILPGAQMPTGFHVSRTAVYYECKTDTLYVGLDVSNPTLDPNGSWVDISGNPVAADSANAVKSRAWDADGDGNPCRVYNPMLVNPTPNSAIGQQGVLDPAWRGNGSQDIPLGSNMSMSEKYVIFLDLNRDTIDDTIITACDDGTPLDELPTHKHFVNACSENPTVHAQMTALGGVIVPGAASGVDYNIIYRTASDSDYATHRDIEFKITGVSKIPLTNAGTPASVANYCDLSLRTFADSDYDSSAEVSLNWGRFNFVASANVDVAATLLADKPSLASLPDTVTYTIQAKNNTIDIAQDITVAAPELGGPWTFANVAPGQTVTVLPAPTKTFDVSFAGKEPFTCSMTVTAVPVGCCVTGTATASASASVVPPSIRNPKLAPNGETASIAEGVVTAVFDDVFYLEPPERAFGLRVTMPLHGFQRYQRLLNVTGTMATTEDGERMLFATGATPGGTADVRPMGLSNRDVGGAGWRSDDSGGAGQMGIWGASGLNNIGMLIRTWGYVTGAGEDWFYCDDGAGVQDGTGTPGVYVQYVDMPITSPGVGDYVAVTGISSCEFYGGNLVTVLRPRDQADITIVKPASGPRSLGAALTANQSPRKREE